MAFHGFDIFKSTSVANLYRHFFRTLYNNASKLIVIEGLEDYVNRDFVMSQLLLSGRIAIFKEKEKMYWLNCNVGGAVDEYYKPSRVLIANPILGSKDLERDSKAVVVHLTPMDILQEYPKTSPLFSYEGGLYSLIAMCSTLLSDNISSINTAQINTRVHAIFTADSDSAAKTGETVLRKIYAGEPYSVVTSEMFSQFHVNPMANSAISKDLIELLEVHQYINAMFWNALGIDCNYNMKRERLITAEVDKNLLSLKVSINTILETLNADFEKVNSVFGTYYHAIMNPEFDMELIQEENGDITTDDSTSSEGDKTAESDDAENTDEGGDDDERDDKDSEDDDS